MDTEIRFEPAQPPAPESRRQRISNALSGSHASPHFVPFHKGYLEAPVCTVDDELLVYRAANGRLVSELAARGIDPVQREDAAQQKLLHNLLIDKARDTAGPIYEELARHGRQTEPLLVTRDGLVVNGNRRLASMRELRARDSERYERFAHVSVMVLPADMSEEDIEYVEAALQMAPELKLDYSWINRRLKLRDHVERLALPETEVMAAYRFEESASIERELDQLATAERYLRYRSMPARYEEVLGLEEPIVSMMRELDRITNKRLSELWTYAGFALLVERERLETQIDKYFPFARPVPFELVHWVMRSYGEEQGVFEPQDSGENQPIKAEDADLLMPLLKDSARSAEVADRIVALSDRLRANQEKEIGGAQILHHLQKAKEGLFSVDVEKIGRGQARKIHAELTALSEYLKTVSQETEVGDENGSGAQTVLGKLFSRR